MILLKLIDINKLFLKFLVIFYPFHQQIIAQNLISFQFEDIHLKSGLSELSKQFNIAIIFPDSIDNPLISSKCDNCSKTEAVLSVISSTSLTWEKIGNQFVITPSNLIDDFHVKGNIIDYNSGEPIPFANVFIKDLNIGDISSRDGTFLISNISTPLCYLVIP